MTAPRPITPVTFESPRVVAWFSRGAASAVAAKLAILDYADVEVVCIGLTTEHPDSARFADECAAWFGQEIRYVASTRYEDTWAVWQGERFLVGNHGAPCTGILKKEVRHQYQRPNDIQIFGYTVEETSRVARFRHGDPLVDIRTPLIERGLTKADCLAIVKGAGIELPAMYRLGYSNNNCIGCVKGGMGYWNKIRVDFPNVFARMAKLERDIGHSILSEEIPGEGRAKRPVWLDELDPARGDFGRDQPADCSIMCAITEQELAAS
jgi:hypothetical protein